LTGPAQLYYRSWGRFGQGQFPGTTRPARGFKGDIAQHHRRLRQGLESGTVAADLLEVRVAHKTLLAVAALVSIHDPHLDDRPFTCCAALE
jgi:hypothetical protein